jgi:hypothetical protein
VLLLLPPYRNHFRRPRCQGKSLAYPLHLSGCPADNLGLLSTAVVSQTPNYIQVQGFLNGNNLNIQTGDEGGELDPHGATGEGNVSLASALLVEES